jgi:aminomethyltransferase
MYDMAHVLGLIGPHFQEPFQRRASIVTGSTHKDLFWHTARRDRRELTEEDAAYPLWEASDAALFPAASATIISDPARLLMARV